MLKFIITLVILSTAMYAVEIKTFGCGITKMAYLTKLNAAYAKKTNHEMKVVGRGGAPRAIQLMGAQKVAVSSGCRPPLGLKGEENVQAHQVAWGAVVAIVNKNNSVSNITSQQFKDILTGKITNWKEVGGEDLSIQVYARNGKTSGVGYSVRMVLFDDKEISFTKDAKRKGSSGPIRRAVTKAINVFAVDDFVTASKNKRLRILSIDGIKPNKQNIQNGKYKYYRPLFLYSYGDPSGENKKYLEFTLSKYGQKIISDNGVVNLEEGKNLKRLY
ncbi:MAG: substrate-binding domain-containing protein [Arcobacteraceae bacterium]|nr:substrate-binding domain-containing protein [Arcobacteraceae bacterium]